MGGSSSLEEMLSCFRFVWIKTVFEIRYLVEICSTTYCPFHFIPNAKLNAMLNFSVLYITKNRFN